MKTPRSTTLSGHRKSDLNVAKILEDFRKTEESSSGRNGTFKIDAPFEKALDTILKAKPEKKPSQPTSLNEVCNV